MSKLTSWLIAVALLPLIASVGCSCDTALTLRMFHPSVVGPDFKAQVTVYELDAQTGPAWYSYFTGIPGSFDYYHQRQSKAVIYRQAGMVDPLDLTLLPNREGLVTISNLKTGDFILLELEGFAPSSILVENAGIRQFSIVDCIDEVAQRHHTDHGRNLMHKQPWPHTVKIWHQDARIVELDDERDLLEVSMLRRK